MTDAKLHDAFFKQPAEPAPIMNEYDKEQLAIHKNRERLKAERLERESTLSPPTK
jgi:hypothetical protein